MVALVVDCKLAALLARTRAAQGATMCRLMQPAGMPRLLLLVMMTHPPPPALLPARSALHEAEQRSAPDRIEALQSLVAAQAERERTLQVRSVAAR